MAEVGNAVKHSWAGFLLHVAVRSANVRIFAERKASAPVKAFEQ